MEKLQKHKEWLENAAKQIDGYEGIFKFDGKYHFVSCGADSEIKEMCIIIFKDGKCQYSFNYKSTEPQTADDVAFSIKDKAKLIFLSSVGCNCTFGFKNNASSDVINMVIFLSTGDYCTSIMASSESNHVCYNTNWIENNIRTQSYIMQNISEAIIPLEKSFTEGVELNESNA